jgi:hypothetical protein
MHITAWRTLIASLGVVLMVVLGAGASFDSVNPKIERAAFTSHNYLQPPLANGLFAENEQFGNVSRSLPQLAGIIPGLRQYAPPSDRGTIEDHLMELESEAESGSLTRRAQVVAVRFYLREVIAICDQWAAAAHGNTNYAELLDRLVVWQERAGEEITFVTFNYDTLLEQAMRGIGQMISSVEGCISDPRLKLVKAHGSINWSHRIDRSVEDLRLESDPQAAIITGVASGSIGVDGDTFIYDHSRQLIDTVGGLVPAIAIPVSADKRFECPGEHVDELARALRETTRLLVIGWAGADKHFLNLMTENKCRPAKGLVVCGTDARFSPATNARLARAITITNCRPEPMGFSDLMRDPDPLDWLLA